MLERLRGILLGGPKNILDPRIHHTLALIAFFAWVGLGSDGLSSSCYGPEEAFLQLGHHRHLSIYLVVAIVSTVFLISASYSYIIELFPSAGRGLGAVNRDEDVAEHRQPRRAPIVSLTSRSLSSRRRWRASVS